MTTVYKLPPILRNLSCKHEKSEFIKKKKSLFVDLAGLFPKFCLMIQKNKKKKYWKINSLVPKMRERVAISLWPHAL